MFLQPDVVLALEGSPPSQAVLDQRPHWMFLTFALGATLLLRMVGCDILGGLLCGLLLLLAAMVMREGMSGLPKFGLLFGMMCGVNCIFYLLPLIGGVVSGRSERRIAPVEAVRYKDMHQLTYTLTVRTTPFFDANAGILYNVQSVGMLMMPLCMLLGAYLGITGHQEACYWRARRSAQAAPPIQALATRTPGSRPRMALPSDALPGPSSTRPRRPGTACSACRRSTPPSRAGRTSSDSRDGSGGCGPRPHPAAC